MTLLIHSLYFHPEVGGMETHVLNLSRELIQRGHRVILVTSHSVPGTPAREILWGIEVYRTPFLGRNPLGWIGTILFSIPRFLIAARQADIIHAHAFASGFPGFLAKKIFRKPLVLTLHTSHFLRLARKKLWRIYFRWLLKRADLLLAPSVQIKRVMKTLLPEKEVLSIVNPVDTETFRPQEPLLVRRDGEKFLFCPRRLVEKNGVRYLLMALPQILTEQPVKLLIAGDGPLRQELTELTEKLGVSDQVDFLGAIPHEEMPAFLASVDLVVIPSLLEATSLAALEAMSCAKPVAASRVGGLPEIIDEQVGVLFEPANPNDLAVKVTEVLRDPMILERRGEQARRRVLAQWSASQLTEQHLEFYVRPLKKYAKDGVLSRWAALPDKDLTQSETAVAGSESSALQEKTPIES